MKTIVKYTVACSLLLLGLSQSAMAQSRVQPDDRRVEKQYRVRGRVSKHNQRRYQDRLGLKSSEYSYDAHFLGGWVDGDYARIFHNVPESKHLGGYSLGLGLTYEFRTSYFLFHTGLGVRWSDVRDSVPNLFLNNTDMASLSGDNRWLDLRDSYGVPINSLNYSFVNRKDYIRSLSLELPIMVGAEINGFYFLVGVKLGFGLMGHCRAQALASTSATYDDRYIGTYGEMDNHGYRKDVPISSTSNFIPLKRFDVSPAVEIGYGWRVENWRIRLSAYADYGLLNSNPGVSLKSVDISYDMRYDFDTFVLNPVYCSPAASGCSMHSLNAGLRFTFIYEFPQRVRGVVGRRSGIKGRSY